MSKTNELIETGVDKILSMACTDPNRRMRAITIMQETVARTATEHRQSVLGIKRRVQSMPKVAAYYKTSDAERERYVREKADLWRDDQITFVESISGWYIAMMGGFTPLQAKVIVAVLDHYYRGANSQEVARACMEAVNTTSSILSRLVKTGLVQSKKNGKPRRGHSFYVEDVNWLRVHALRNMQKWLEDDKGSGEDIIDRYITWYLETTY